MERNWIGYKGITSLLLLIVLSSLLVSLGFLVFKTGLTLTNKSRDKGLDTKLPPSSPMLRGDSYFVSATAEAVRQDRDYKTRIEVNPDNANLYDIYLIDTSSKEEIYYITLSDVYKSHYHSSEFYKGDLYVIHRTGGDSGYENNPNWNDGLWRYDSDKKGYKLIEGRGVDFRIVNKELIATRFNGSDKLDVLAFVGIQGELYKKFNEKELIDGDPGGLDLYYDPTSNTRIDNIFWVTSYGGPGYSDLASINLNSYEVKKYNLSDLWIGFDSDLNQKAEMIAFSDYPVFFDQESQESFQNSKNTITLSLYDLKSNNIQIIATSVNKRFAPKWLDEDTLEYEDPVGSGRVTKKI